MFIVRTAFWLSLVVLLLPTDARQQERLYQSASAAVHRVSTVCERHAELCARGAEHWAIFRQKLDFGARMAVNLASERLAGTPRRETPAQPVQPTSGSLTPADMQPAWRGKGGRVGA